MSLRDPVVGDIFRSREKDDHLIGVVRWRDEQTVGVELISQERKGILWRTFSPFLGGINPVPIADWPAYARDFGLVEDDDER